jgi:hypothetical protein
MRVEADIADRAVVNGALDVVDVFDVDLHKGRDLLPLLPIRTARCTIPEDVAKDVLLIAARPCSALLRLIAASMFIEFLDIEIGFGIDFSESIEAPDLQCMLKGGTRAVAESVVLHHAKV